jgi:signal transduction histidine kinase
MEYSNGRWQHHLIPEIEREIQRRIARPIDPIPLYPVRQGRVVFLLPDRLMEFSAENPERPRTRQLRASAQGTIGSFESLVPAHDGGLWVSGTHGLAKIPGPVRSLRPETPWTEHVLPSSLGIANLRRPTQAKDGTVTMTGDGLEGESKVVVHFDGTNWAVEKIGSERIRLAWRGPDGATWAAKVDRLYRREYGEPELVEYEGLTARQYFDLAVEPTGAFWLASSEGLFRFAEPAWTTPLALRTQTSPVHCIAADRENRLWFCTSTGLNLVVDEQHYFFPFPPEHARHFQLPRGIYPAREKVAVQGTGRILWFDVQSRVFTPVPDPSSDERYEIVGLLPSDGVLAQVVTGEESSGPTRLVVLDPRGVDNDEFLAPASGGSRVSAWFTSQNGDTWVATDVGVAWAHGGGWQIFKVAEQNGPEEAFGFIERSDGAVWCATRDKVWEFSGRYWSVVPSGGFDRIHGICRTRDDSVWVASNTGVYRYFRGAWVQNDVDEGLPSTAARAVVEDRRGRLWAATSAGVARFNPEIDPDPPETLISGQTRVIPRVRQHSTYTVSFRGVDKWKNTLRDRLLYSYRLDEADWSLFSDQDAVTFADLSGGRHYFQVRAMDRNCNVDPTPALLEFVVVVPWFKDARLVVITAVGLSAIVFFAGLAWNRHRQLLRSYADIEQKVTQRTRELEVANQRLAHSQKMTALGTLAAGVAHDFNNILSIIKGSAQIIEANLGDADKVRTRVGRIKTVVDQGAGIVKAMLGFSREDAVANGECDLNSVVTDTVRLLGDRFLREVQLECNLAEKLPPVRGAREFIQQILLNFVFNAADALQERKQIIVGTGYRSQLPADLVLSPEPPGQAAFVEVRDFGCGIAPENMERIFEPFFTTKSLSARRGTGLGLSMVYELARKMGAGLSVESIPGQGSTFTLYLRTRESERSAKPTEL